jgi:hypothetical protein
LNAFLNRKHPFESIGELGFTEMEYYVGIISSSSQFKNIDIGRDGTIKSVEIKIVRKNWLDEIIDRFCRGGWKFGFKKNGEIIGDDV